MARTKEEVSGALAAYLVEPGFLAPAIREELDPEEKEVYGWSLEAHPPELPLLGNFTAEDVFWVVDGLYVDTLAGAMDGTWPEDWLAEPSIDRSGNVYTIVAQPLSPSFRELEAPRVFSKLGIPVREARKRLADARRISTAVKDAAATANELLRNQEFWVTTAPQYVWSRRKGPRRQDWRPWKRRT